MDNMIQFRLDDNSIEALKEIAKDFDVSLSDLIRPFVLVPLKTNAILLKDILAKSKDLKALTELSYLNSKDLNSLILTVIQIQLDFNKRITESLTNTESVFYKSKIIENGSKNTEDLLKISTALLDEWKALMNRVSETKSK